MTFSKEFLEYISEANPKMAEALQNGFEKNAKEVAENDKLNKYKKSSEVFGEFLKKAHEDEEINKEAEPINYNFLPKDGNIIKVAGMAVYDNTPEGIEQFLKEYMRNELSFFPDRVELAVGIMPLDNVPVNNGTGQLDSTINNASGTVDIMYGGALIQIPWIMRDKEILPFDTIQLGTETAVYTRENIKNILFNLKAMVEKQKDAGTFNLPNPEMASYVGTDKTTNNLTDRGYMNDMLQIQNMLGSHGSGGAYAYASKIEDLLEKTANIKEVNVDYKQLKDELSKEFLAAAEKVASAEYDEPEEQVLQKQALFDSLNKKVLADINILNNGEKFSFTEKDGMIVSEVEGIIYKSLVGVEGLSLDDNLVITSDRRFKILKPGEKFMFNLEKSKEVVSFELKKRKFTSLNPGYVYTAEIGGTCLVPFVVNKVISGAERSLNIDIFYHCTDVNGEGFTIIPVDNVSDNKIVRKSKKDILSQVLKTEEPKKLSYYNVILHKDNPIICLSPNTEFIELRPGEIGNMTSPKEDMLLYDGNVKLASYKDQVEVTLVSRDGDPKFNIKANWFDKKHSRDSKFEMENISENKLKGILKTIGFDYNKVSEIAYRATKEGNATYELGPWAKPWMVKPDVTAGMAAENTVKSMRDAFFNEENAKKALIGVTGGLIGGALAGTTMGQRISNLGKFAKESEALAEKLEKIAMAKESGTFTKLAGLMVIKNRLDNMVLNAIDGKEYEGTEVLAELQEINPFLEKIAYDLVELKVRQAVLKDEIVSPNVINATLKHLDGLHKYAMHFNPIEKGATVNGYSYDTSLAKTDVVDATAKTTKVPEKPPKPGKPLVGEPLRGPVNWLAETSSTLPGMLGIIGGTTLLGRKLKKVRR